MRTLNKIGNTICSEIDVKTVDAGVCCVAVSFVKRLEREIKDGYSLISDTRKLLNSRTFPFDLCLLNRPPHKFTHQQIKAMSVVPHARHL